MSQAARPSDATLTDLVTTTGAGRRANKSNETIRTWARTGRLPVAVRLENGTRLFRVGDVENAAAHRDRR